VALGKSKKKSQQGNGSLDDYMRLTRIFNEVDLEPRIASEQAMENTTAVFARASIVTGPQAVRSEQTAGNG
jgi:hypothetical protein